MIVLASASPRRQELLRNAEVLFEIRPASVDETPLPGEPAQKYVLRLAESKARTVAKPGATVLGADTVVVMDQEILGKPVDQKEAVTMLRRLSGQVHEVMTAVCILCEKKSQTFVETTVVHFRELSEQEIQTYASSGESLDKAGAYGIQTGASKFVERIEGCYFNVVGLPIAHVYKLLQSFVPLEDFVRK